MAARGTKSRGGGRKRRPEPEQTRAASAQPAVETDDLPEEDEESRRHGRTDDGTAFMPDPEDGPAYIDDSLAENLAEEFLESATRGEPVVDDILEEVVPEEIGGPFLETSSGDEFAGGTDPANPPDAEREALPRPVAGLVQTPAEGREEPGDE